MTTPFGLDPCLFRCVQSSARLEPPFRNKAMEILGIILKHLETSEKDCHLQSLSVFSKTHRMLFLLQEFRDTCFVSYEILELKSRSVNEFGRKVFEMVAENGTAEMCRAVYQHVKSNEGCLVGIYKDLLVMRKQQEKKTALHGGVDARVSNERDKTVLSRVLFFIEQNADFQDSLTAHEDLDLCFDIIQSACGPASFLQKKGKKLGHSCRLEKKRAHTNYERACMHRNRDAPFACDNILWSMCIDYEFCGCIYACSQ